MSQQRNNFNYNFESRKPSFSVNGIVGLFVAILFLVGLFYLAKFVFNILYMLSPIMLIATLIIDHRVVTGFLKSIGQLFRRSPFMGIAAVLFTVFLFPLVAAYLLARALLTRKVKQVQEQYIRERDGELVDFEEIVDEPKLKLSDEEARLLRQSDTRSSNSSYDDMFR